MVLELKDSRSMDLHYVEAMETDKITEGQTTTRQESSVPGPCSNVRIRKKMVKAEPWEHPHLVHERNCKYRAVGRPSSVSVGYRPVSTLQHICSSQHPSELGRAAITIPVSQMGKRRLQGSLPKISQLVSESQHQSLICTNLSTPFTLFAPRRPIMAKVNEGLSVDANLERLGREGSRAQAHSDGGSDQDAAMAADEDVN